MTTRNLYHSKPAQWAVYGLFSAAIAAFPAFVSDGFLLNPFAVYGIYGMLALSISLCRGFGGILNLGQGIAFGLAAYGMAMTMQMQSQDPVHKRVPLRMRGESPKGKLIVICTEVDAKWRIARLSGIRSAAPRRGRPHRRWQAGRTGCR